MFSNQRIIVFFVLQVDRQQVRIRGLIEEQDSKVDEERSLVERRAQEQLRQVREEAEAQAGFNFNLNFNFFNGSNLVIEHI